MKLPIAAIFLLFSGGVFAQSVLNKQVICMDSASMLKALVSDEIQEKVYWIGKSDDTDSKYALFVNPKTKKWTVLQLNEKIACVLGTGDNSIVLEESLPVKK